MVCKGWTKEQTGPNSLKIKNKFVRTKMRPKEGTKIELQRDLSDFQV